MTMCTYFVITHGMMNVDEMVLMLTADMILIGNDHWSSHKMAITL